MKTLKTQLPEKYHRTFQFYADYYEISVTRLMECEIYEQATVITDEPFRSLAFLDRNHCDEDLRPISLSFSNQIASLLHKISKLLRRPATELAQDLLTEGAIVLASHMEEAFKKGGMEHGWNLDHWAKASIEFAALAKADESPITRFGTDENRHELDCWDTFIVKRPRQYRSKEISKS